MKIVFISRAGPPTYSGAGRRVFNYAKLLRKAGYDVTYLTGQFSSEMPKLETVQGVPFFRFPVRNASSFASLMFYTQCAWWLLRHRNSFDIIHISNMPKIWVPVLLVAKLLGKIVYVTMTLYGSDDLPSIRKKRLGRIRLWLYRQCNAILAISERLCEVSSNYVINGPPIICLSWSVDLREFRPCEDEKERSQIRKNYCVPIATHTAVFSGSVIKRKGVDLLVEAWHIVRQSLPNAMLYIVGPRNFGSVFNLSNRSFSKYIDNRVRLLNLGKNIIFTGEMCEHVPKFLKMANIFVFPSRQEGLGGALVEAMASGLPVIVTKHPWLPESLVRHNKTGLIAEPTPEALAESILMLLTNPELAKRMGKEARREAEREYSPEKIISRLLDIYSSSLGET